MKINAFLFIILVSLHAFTANAGTYNFNELFQNLGYPTNPTYFGSSEEEIQDLETYTSKEDTFYKEINSYLRYFPAEYDWNGIGPSDAKIIVNHIDQIFKRVPSLPQDIVLFRGINLNFHGNKSYKTGEEFIEKGYVSTSTNFKIAKYFAVEKDKDSEEKTSRKAILVYYSNQPNPKGILIDQGEDEVILEHGERIRIMATKNINSGYDLYLAQICTKICETKPTQDAFDTWEKLK